MEGIGPRTPTSGTAKRESVRTKLLKRGLKWRDRLGSLAEISQPRRDDQCIASV